jgi:tight adherence protein C
MNPATQRLLRLNQPPREVLLDRIIRQGRESEEEQESLLTVIKEKVIGLVSILNTKNIENLSHTERLRFTKAGIRGSGQVQAYLGIRTTFSITLSSTYLVYGLIKGHGSLTILFLLMLSFVAGYSLFNLWLTSKIRKRNQMIGRNVHDAIDLLMICLEAGLGLNVALLKVGENMRYINVVLSEEFLLLNHEIQAGSTRIEAYRNMRNRVNVRELRSLLTMLIQSETLGTSLGQVLKAYSDTLRTKIRQNAEEQANKAGVKMAIPLVVFIFPPLFVVVLGPAVLQVIRLLEKFF